MDYMSRPVIRERLGELIARGGRSIVLDLSGVTFCDSAGLNILLVARLQADDRGAELVLACVSPQLQRILQMTGADQVLLSYASVDEAETALCG
jgi:anti-sigma B factor antagonist